jgi:hypothetical protein
VGGRWRATDIDQDLLEDHSSRLQRGGKRRWRGGATRCRFIER